MKLKGQHIAYLLAVLLVGFALATWAQPKYSDDPNDRDSKFAFELVEQMFESCQSVNTMYCEVKKKERYDGDYVEAESRIKMSCEPYCVYLKQLDKEDGVELLYREDQNNGKVLVNPNGFPWINISLDPYGSLIRSKQHHLILDIGFSKFNQVLAHLMNKYEGKAQDFLTYAGTQTISGRSCYVVDLDNKNYELISYTTKEGESTVSISRDFMISEYRIVELNDAVSSYGAVKPGIPLTIPNDYAPKLRLYIDEERFIPMRFDVYDDQGELFESYQYDKVVLNAQFGEDELTEDYHEYGF